MVKRSKAPNPFTGRWRVASIDQWDPDYIDEEEEGYFEFTDKDWDEFHFGYLDRQMDCRLTTGDGEPAAEWSWDGNAEMDAVRGRGWAVRKGYEGPGMIVFHDGEDSEFGAKKVKAKKRPNKGK